MKYFPLATAALLLSACHSQKAEQAPAAPASANLVITGGRLVLPAVPGHPAAAYFSVLNLSHAPVTITGVQLADAASAEMHQTSGDTMAALPRLEIAGDGSAIFSPGGRHVMIFGLSPKVKAGQNEELTLTIANAKPVTLPLHVESAGGTDMSGMASSASSDAMASMKM
ncbi:MAG TPA: copper chaperone PCu(A)C [Novosphingobium sp.]|nr:copper chaperone PCu(A)C [Novosphingobium sp.]HZV10915.1 copper chaperone PCu(A)C [Novosphingobium sp.]